MSFRDRGGWWVAAQFALFGAIAVAAWTDGPEISDGALWATILGFALMADGFLLAVLAFGAMGFNVTIFPEPANDSVLATTGVYRFVRHPIYGGVILLFVGGMLLVDSLIGLVLALALIPFFWAKAGHEEVRLIERHPAYAAYRDQVRWRLIPFIA
ncbi:MAG: isoprenylcysteine carboxylmethyltransferase family protein [Acidimicrobiia bacterium]|nr:isoprenylcysteine carboxylmethyltransferase family protein [Acidimicrobiia bacterium]NNF68896.1 isoprenylcysteine carboxylmethyltransferase family protein [Acidimicrobiia bacterium]NNK92115.1 isoprenylcysteine carboxylmethyltransferase family protein [Acidimicrobiia bacterium]